MNLRKWDYKIELSFDNKLGQKLAIDQIKKLKFNYDLVYHYDFKRNYRQSRYLMDQREYERLADYSRKKKEGLLEETIIRRDSELD